jgi:hypothetical protein
MEDGGSGWPRHKARPYLKNNQSKKVDWAVQVVEYLSVSTVPWVQTPVLLKKKKKKRKKRKKEVKHVRKIMYLISYGGTSL